MKTLAIILLVIFLTPFLTNAQQFNKPESAVYDSLNQRYLISNTGNGDIIARASDGTLSFFNNTKSTSIRGVTILGDRLYAAGDEGVIGFDLASGNDVITIAISEGNFLNDITSDGDGFLYVSDGVNVFKVNPGDGSYSTFVNSANGTNGLLYDETNNRLLATDDVPPGQGGSRIIAINLADSSIQEIVKVPFDFLDGLAEDNEGRIYVSSWETNTVYMYDKDFTNAPEVIKDGYDGPADIFFDKINNVLVVPNFNKNDVDFIEIGAPTSIDNKSFPDKFELKQNYPNPFNPSTKIKFTVPSLKTRHSVSVRLKVYDVLGNELATLVNKELAPGNYEIEFNSLGMNLSSGVYIYKLSVEGFLQAKKMLLLR